MAGDLKVLLVEDSNLLSDRLLELISDTEGLATVGTATTEAEAIRALEADGTDAVILDLRLKEGTGFGVLRYLRKLAKPPVVIVMTNYALPQYRTQAETLGARYFLDKSQEFDQLPSLLESIREERMQ